MFSDKDLKCMLSLELHSVCICVCICVFLSYGSTILKCHFIFISRCLVHILRETTVKYSKIRSYHSQCQLDLCRHEVRYGCLREDECFYAHSLIELKVWILQKENSKCRVWLKMSRAVRVWWNSLRRPFSITLMWQPYWFCPELSAVQLLFKVAYFE